MNSATRPGARGRAGRGRAVGGGRRVLGVRAAEGVGTGAERVGRVEGLRADCCVRACGVLKLRGKV